MKMAAMPTSPGIVRPWRRSLALASLLPLLAVAHVVPRAAGMVPADQTRHLLSSDTCAASMDAIVSFFECTDEAIDGCDDDAGDDCEEVCYPREVSRDCVSRADALSTMRSDEVEELIAGLAECPSPYAIYGGTEPNEMFGGFTGLEYTKQLIRHKFRICELGDAPGWQSDSPCAASMDAIVSFFECTDEAIDGCDDDAGDDCEEVCYPREVSRDCVSRADALSTMRSDEVEELIAGLAECPSPYAIYGGTEPNEMFGGFTGLEYTKQLIRHKFRICELGDAPGWQSNDPCTVAIDTILPVFTCFESVATLCDDGDRRCEDSCSPSRLSPDCEARTQALTPTKLDAALVDIATCPNEYAVYGGTEPSPMFGGSTGVQYVHGVLDSYYSVCMRIEPGEWQGSHATKSPKSKTKKSKKSKKSKKKTKKLSKKQVKKLCKKAKKSKKKCRKGDAKKNCKYTKKKGCVPK